MSALGQKRILFQHTLLSALPLKPKRARRTLLNVIPTVIQTVLQE